MAKRAVEMLECVLKAVNLWPEAAGDAWVPEDRVRQIQAVQRLSIPE
jgi:hypothetical protein